MVARGVRDRRPVHAAGRPDALRERKPDPARGAGPDRDQARAGLELLCRRRHKSWDITDLRTPWRGVAFKAYCAMDIFSRKVVGSRVEEREVDDLAAEMFPFSESEFRTMKYRPGYPGTFETLEEARAHLDEFVAWYYGNHKHSGIALFSPNEVHDGSWREAWQRRDAVQQAYYDAHPERFRNRPRTPVPAGLAGINQPKPEPQPQPA